MRRKKPKCSVCGRERIPGASCACIMRTNAEWMADRRDWWAQCGMHVGGQGSKALCMGMAAKLNREIMKEEMRNAG